MSATTPDRIRTEPLQRRVLAVLSAGQILGGVGMGAAISLGSLLAADVGESEALAGFSTTMVTLGAAAFAIPLARLARGAGRRFALAAGTTAAAAGAALVIGAAVARSFPLLLVGFALLGAGSAVNLQTRFAAVDLAGDRHRGRDLSLVIWATTVGVVLGPNLAPPGDAIGRTIGLPALTGAFALAVACQLLAAVLYLVLLRPDPLLEAQRRAGITDAPPPDAATPDAALPDAATPDAALPDSTPPDAATSAVPPDAAALGAAEPGPGVHGHPDGRAPARRRNPLLVLARNRAALVAVVALALSHATMVGVMAMTPVHLETHGATIAVIGLTISLHTAGMYALSPLFGWLSDRLGRPAVILLGQAALVASLLLNLVADDDQVAVAVALVLLGLGWSASTIAASALLTESVSVAERTGVQGVSDTAMNLCGAAGGAIAGPVLASLGYGLLNAYALVLIAVVVAGVALARRAIPAG